MSNPKKKELTQAQLEKIAGGRGMISSSSSSGTSRASSSGTFGRRRLPVRHVTSSSTYSSSY